MNKQQSEMVRLLLDAAEEYDGVIFVSAARELERLAAQVEQQRAESLPLSVARDVVIANCANCGGHGWVMVTGAVMGPDGGPEPVPMQEQCQYCGIVCDALNEAAQAAARGD